MSPWPVRPGLFLFFYQRFFFRAQTLTPVAADLFAARAVHRGSRRASRARAVSSASRRRQSHQYTMYTMYMQ